MQNEITFAGDELMLLSRMDAAGCVLTDDGKFYCDVEIGKLPLRVTGTYAPVDDGWRIAYRMGLPPKMLAMGGVFAALFLFGIVTWAQTGVKTSALLFGILTAALAVNFLSQKKGCAKRFEGLLLGKVQL